MKEPRTLTLERDDWISLCAILRGVQKNNAESSNDPVFARYLQLLEERVARGYKGDWVDNELD